MSDIKRSTDGTIACTEYLPRPSNLYQGCQVQIGCKLRPTNSFFSSKKVLNSSRDERRIDRFVFPPLFFLSPSTHTQQNVCFHSNASGELVPRHEMILAFLVVVAK